ILIADDMAIFREPLEAAFGAAGYAVVAAPSGTAALGAMRNRVPDMVVLDMDMPGSDGVAVLTRMRQDSKLRDVPVLILSAESDRTRIIEAARLGISGYMLKSQFSLKHLLERIQSILSPARIQ